MHIFSWFLSTILTISAVLSRLSISKLPALEFCIPGIACSICWGSTDDGAGELSPSGENKSLPELPSILERK